MTPVDRSYKDDGTKLLSEVKLDTEGGSVRRMISLRFGAGLHGVVRYGAEPLTLAFLDAILKFDHAYRKREDSASNISLSSSVLILNRFWRKAYMSSSEASTSISNLAMRQHKSRI